MLVAGAAMSVMLAGCGKRSVTQEVETEAQVQAQEPEVTAPQSGGNTAVIQLGEGEESGIVD